MLFFPILLVLSIPKNPAVDLLYVTTIEQEKAKLIKLQFDYETTLNSSAASILKRASLSSTFLENQLLRQRANIILSRSRLWNKVSNDTLAMLQCNSCLLNSSSCVRNKLLCELATNPMLSLCHSLRLSIKFTRAVKHAARPHLTLQRDLHNITAHG